MSRYIKVAAFVECCRAAVREMPRGPAQTKLDVHQTVCMAIAFQAPGYGCDVMREYRVRLGSRVGLIDVVWLCEEKPVIAFEVDQRGKKRSLAKLLSLQCKKCLVSLRDGPLKGPIPSGVERIVLGVRPWRRSTYNPDDV